jgi:hypothetical protein
MIKDTNAPIDKTATAILELFEIRGHNSTTLDIIPNQAKAIKEFTLEYLTRTELRPAYIDAKGVQQPPKRVPCTHYTLWYLRNGCKMQIHPTATIGDYVQHKDKKIAPNRSTIVPREVAG